MAAGIVNRWLVLAPLRVCKEVWPQEQAIWAPGITLAVASGAQRSTAFTGAAQVVVINYELLQWLCDTHPELLSGFDGLVLDELTRMKSQSGVRFKALFKRIAQFKMRIGLTGSFTSNGLEDVFGQCKVVDQALLGRAKGAFMQEYFVLINKDFGEWEPRKGSLERVMQRIKPATFLLEGQSSTTQTHVVELRCDMPMKEYNEMKKDFVVQFPTAKAIATNAAVVTSKLQQMSSGFVYNTTVDLSGPGRTHQTPIWFDTTKFDRLEELLAENQRAPTIVFYTFKEEQAELLRRYPPAQTLDSPNAIERWNKGEVELLLAHPKSAGHGLNLQHGGNKCVFLSLPWSLELYEQAIGRLQRSGQKHDVWVYVMLTNNTVDERIFAALRDKRSISDIAIGALK